MLFYLWLLLPLQTAAAVPSDSLAALRLHARQAEATYERLLRQRAPLSRQGGGGSGCDERVGRFCLRFDSTGVPGPDPEHSSVTRARTAAIDAARRYFEAARAERAAAGPLTRLLVADGRAAEAVDVARAYAHASRAHARASDDSLWPHLLAGMALHAAGDDAAAEQELARGLAGLDPAMRRAWLDPEWLVDPAERRHLTTVSPSERAEYERRFWRMADPFWLTAANESWVEHLSRQVESQLLAEAPPASGVTRWGPDLHELTVRYGTPQSRTRHAAVAPTGFAGRPALTEHWDTVRRAYAPARLSDGVPGPPAPGERPLLYSNRARWTYTFRPVTRVLELQHQVSRFIVDGEPLVRVDGVVRRDSAGEGGRRTATAAPLPVGLFAWDSAFGVQVRATGFARWSGDSATLVLQLAAPAGRIIYGVEALDTAADVAARARHSLEPLPLTRSLVLSDLLICAPFETERLPDGPGDDALRGRSSLVLARGDTVGVYAELYGMSHGAASALRIELALEASGSASWLGRLARRAGEALGVLGPLPQLRVAWRADRRDVHVIALNLPLDPAIRGRHTLVLRIEDAATGEVSVSTRELHVGDL